MYKKVHSFTGEVESTTCDKCPFYANFDFQGEHEIKCVSCSVEYCLGTLHICDFKKVVNNKYMKLRFRAKLPNGEYFYQKNQYLTSFLRRVLTFWEVAHPTYLRDDLENKLEIELDGKWIKCSFN